MKTKLLFFTILLLLQGQSLFSQCITIELSITWEMKNDIFIQDSVVNTPFLNITYHNNCTENYYFFKVSSKGAEKNVHSIILSHSNDSDFKKIAKNNLNYYTNYNYNVTIGGKPLYYIGWWIDCTKEDYNKEWAGITVGNSICEIYSYLYNEKYIIPENPVPFLASDITPENILNSVLKEQFVFLGPGEVHTDSYNLIAYKIVGGCFTFLIEHNTIENYVVIYRPNFEEKNYTEQEIELPEIVGEYHLYSGAFNTNKVTVCFGGE